MFENHMLQPEDVKDIEYKEDVNFKLIVPLEDLEKTVEGDEDLEKLLDEALDNCLRYTESILKMNKIVNSDSKEDFDMEIADASDKRRRLHNLTIDSIKILSRTIGKKGRDNSWIDKLNIDSVGDNRAHYARFAVALTMYRIANLD